MLIGGSGVWGRNVDSVAEESGMVFGYFEVGIAIAVGLAIGLVWLINKRSPSGQQINVPAEVIGGCRHPAGNRCGGGLELGSYS